MMQDYNNGHVVDVNKIPTTDYESAAREWSEGSKALEELLLYCLKNNIITQSCCVGHKDTDMSFLQFELSERNIGPIIKIINRYYNLDGINMTFVNQPGIISKFDIRVPKNIGEQFFKDMLIQLSSGLNIQPESLPLEMKSTLDAMLKHKIPNDYLEIQYFKNNGEKKLFVATANPYYSDLYWNNEKAKPWVENSVSIEDSPENIIPIINDISKKAPIVYSDYVETQRRIGNQIPNSSQIEQEKTSDILIEEEPVAIVANAQASRENDYARKNNTTIVEVLPGMSIEQVAKEICGKKYIGKFNDFEIDGTKYTNPEQIVEAYKKNYEEHKKNLQEKQEAQSITETKTDEEPIKTFTVERDKQRQLDASVREQQVSAMQQANKNTQEMQQMISETTQDNSIGGMNR